MEWKQFPLPIATKLKYQHYRWPAMALRIKVGDQRTKGNRRHSFLTIDAGANLYPAIPIGG